MLQGSFRSIFAIDSEFLSLVTLPVALQPTDDIMLLSGWNLRQTTYNEQDWRLTIDKQTIGNCFYLWWQCRTYPMWNCLHKLKLILLWSYLIYVLRMVTCCIRSCLSVIFQARVVLTRTVVVVDWHLKNLIGGYPSWLWRLLPLRLSKRQSTTRTTRVLLKTTFTREITLKQGMWLLGSNHSQLF